jgi:hypothetical protein
MKANSTTLITPRLKVLSEDQKETLFLSVLEVLERTRVRVDNDEGLELLSSVGARLVLRSSKGIGPHRRVCVPLYLKGSCKKQLLDAECIATHSSPLVGAIG